MTPRFRRGGAARALLLASAVAAGAPAWSGDRAAQPRGPWLATYRQECGSCHVAYPPGMLPAASWQRLMGNLPRHFGVDASLDPATQKTLAEGLEAHAATSRHGLEAPPEDRITRSAWFLREHREAHASAAAKRPADCGACHARAQQGAFDEHDLRIPR